MALGGAPAPTSLFVTSPPAAGATGAAPAPALGALTSLSVPAATATATSTASTSSTRTAPPATATTAWASAGLVATPPAAVAIATVWTGDQAIQTFRIAGLYFGQTYFAGNGLIPLVLPPPPPPKPKEVRLVREMPPTRQVITIATPRGYRYRWASDESVGENIPSGVRNSSTAPGGFEQFDAVLSRNPNITYSDLEPMATITAEGVDGSLIGEYRLEATPDTSGDQMSISPSAVGWQAALNDADAQSLIVIDRDLSHWANQDSQQRQADLRNGATAWPPSAGRSYAITGGFDPAVGVLATLSATASQPVQDAAATVASPWSLWESIYDGGSGTVIGKIKFNYRTYGAFGPGWVLNVLLWNTTWQRHDGSWSGAVGLSSTAGAAGEVDAPSTDRGWRRAVLQLYYPGVLAVVNNPPDIVADITTLRVIGPHGLQPYDNHDSAGNPIWTNANPLVEGYLASDIVKYVVQNFVPMLSCDDSTIQKSSFIVPQAFYVGVKPGDMINDAIKFGEPTPDWFVWGDRKLWLYERGTRGNHWRARTGPAKLTESGADITKLFNKVWVTYTDVSGYVITVGPPPLPSDWCVPDRSYGPGGDVDTLDTRLVDNEPDNPLNQLRDANGSRMIKQGVLTLASPVGNPDDAARIGHDFLLEAKQLSSAGQATITGCITDARTGNLAPYHQIRAGDDIEFVDAASTAPRRIQHADLDDSSRVATLALDSPPDTLQGLLERLGATLLPLGL
jgi:hypothetical protein